MKNNINLLPKAYRRRVMLRTRAWQWVGIWCLVSAIGTALGWSGYREHVHVKAELKQIERSYEPTVKLLDELKTMRAEAETLGKQESTAAELEDPRPALTLLAVVTEAARKCENRLRVTEFKLGRVGERGVGSRLQANHLRHLLVLRGHALDMRGAPKFVDALRSANIFAKIDLKDTTNEIVFGHSLSVFHVECLF